MENLISEVQSIFIIIMGLLSLILIFFLPRHLESNVIFSRARKFLTAGTILVTIHFIIQYIIHKRIADVELTRTFVNLTFGYLISYSFCMSMLYLQRRGHLRKWMWLTAPAIALTAYVTAALFYIISPENMSNAVIVMAVLYAMELMFNASMLVGSYIHIIRLNRFSADDSYMLLINWTRWSTCLMIMTGLGYPIMTFNDNLLMRSIYGLLAVCVGFFYIVSFIGYGFARKDITYEDDTEDELLTEMMNDDEEYAPVLNEKKMKKIEDGLVIFENEHLYLKPEVTMREVANRMGVSLNSLRNWLRISEYKKFNNWIICYRISYAKELYLNDPGISSEVVAEQCGFCDRQYFQKMFTKHVGVSPSKWIKSSGHTSL